MLCILLNFKRTVQSVILKLRSIFCIHFLNFVTWHFYFARLNRCVLHLNCYRSDWVFLFQPMSMYCTYVGQENRCTRVDMHDVFGQLLKQRLKVGLAYEYGLSSYETEKHDQRHKLKKYLGECFNSPPKFSIHKNLLYRIWPYFLFRSNILKQDDRKETRNVSSKKFVFCPSSGLLQ